MMPLDVIGRDTRTKVLLALVGLALSALFLWLAFRGADRNAVWRSLEEARIALVALAVGMLGAVYGFQAARWRRIADVPHVSLRRFYGMTLGGLACNNVLPIRVGELFRARWLGRDAPMPGGRALGTVAIDRGCDVVTLAVFLGIGIVAVASADWLVRIAVGAVVLLVLLGLALIFARLYTAKQERGRRTRGRARRIVRDTVERLAEPIDRRSAAIWLGLSVCAWTLWAAAAIVVGRSVGVSLGVLDAVFLTAVMNLGVAIPSSPGYIGTYQWLGVASLGLLDVPLELALAFTIVLHASWYVPTTLVGGAFVIVRALRSNALGREPAR